MEKTGGRVETQRPRQERSWKVSAGRAMLVAGTVASLSVLGSGCLTRKVSGEPPSTKINYNTQVRQSAVDKIDLLFAIDNSQSMGDKQALLREAVPDLINQLLTPACLGPDGKPNGKTVDVEGRCADGKPEFERVDDIHIGIVSSSLGDAGASAGGRAGGVCPPVASPPDPRKPLFPDDQAHMITRNNSDPNVVRPSGFLTWLPATEKNKDKKPDPMVSVPPGPKSKADPEKLVSFFQEIVSGVRETGCGFEAQMESAYRFLVQPDPYASIARKGENEVELVGVDEALLEQRKNFLRPDSLVAVIMLTDENESSIDPMALSAHGWYYNVADPVAPGTNECQTDPFGPNCGSCYQTNYQNDKPECEGGRARVKNDHANVRFFRMKERFGVDPRFPVERYTRGFSDPKVPNRDGEHPGGPDNPSFAYVGNPNCTNPLFAQDLKTKGTPDELCNLPKGPRTPDLVFFALIGGVPWQLLTENPSDPNAQFKASLNAADWTRILGANPLRYDYTGADPHMKESTTPREGVPPAEEWDTKLANDPNSPHADLQYACTFDLPAPKDCSTTPTGEYCDCQVLNNKEPTSPLCQPNGTKGRTLQTKGKAYPTIHELVVARDLKDQGIVASICPRTLDKASPDYGYRPAVRTIVGRLKSALAERCISQPLKEEDDGSVPCLILEVQPNAGPQETGCNIAGREQPESGVLTRFRAQQQQDDPTGLDKPVCKINQIRRPDFTNGSCVASNTPGWCYVTRGNNPNETCAQSIKFAELGKPPNGAVVKLQCIIEGDTPDAGP